MNKKHYLVAAAFMAMAATNAHAQAVVSEDMTVEYPVTWGDLAGNDSIIIAGATVTMMNDPVNTCGLPIGDGTKLIMTDDAKIVMFDSPDKWYPTAEDAIELGFDPNDVVDGNTQEPVTSTAWNIRMDGSGTLVADSKCVLGGSVTGTGDLTIEMGDSTILNIDFFGFEGRLILKYKDGAKNNEFIIGGRFPGYCQNCGQNLSNPSCKCWCSIPWVMEVPDGVFLNAAVQSIENSKNIWSNQHTAFPAIVGKHSIYAPATLTLKPGAECTYDLISYTGGGDNRNLEIFSGENVTFTSPIDYTCSYLYIRNKYVGLWINSTFSEPTLQNMINCISVRNNDGFVGGIGNIGGNGIDCKDGTTTHIRPGEGFDQIGDLTITGNLYMNNNNALDVDFGANGAHDRLLMPNPEGACYVKGANTRLWINLLDEFYTAPKAGDYRVINAANFVPNTVYIIQHIGTKFADLDAETLADTINKWVAADSVRNATYTQEMKDSVSALWVADTMATGYYNLERIDTLGSYISQKVSWQVATREDGTREDSLPAGYSWYPTEWDGVYDEATIASMRDSLIDKKFFESGVISIYGPGYQEGNIITPPVTKIEDEVAAEEPNHGRIISSQIYTADGKIVPSAVKGINVIRNVYEDGTVTTRKVIIE